MWNLNANNVKIVGDIRAPLDKVVLYAVENILSLKVVEYKLIVN